MSMPKPLTVSTRTMTSFVTPEALARARARAVGACRALVERRCEGQEFLGWIDLPDRMQGPPLEAISTVAKRLRTRHPALVVVGIGGSSLGTRAALTALGRGAEEFPVPGDPWYVVFTGHHLSGDVLTQTLRSLEGIDYAVNVISKSGTTTEPGITFRVLLDELSRRHGEGWKERVVATTDPTGGALRALASEQGLTTFEVPNDVGGRFSVLSAVGLLPLAFAGFDITEMLAGAAAMRARCLLPESEENPAIELAAARHALYEAGYLIEVLSFTSPRLRRVAAWWQQLFGESEGKAGKGPFPATLEIPADLHSLGQYLQEGRRSLYETFLHVEEEDGDRAVPDGDSRDGLAYLAGTSLSRVLDAARRGTLEAHLDGGVPALEITAPSLTPYTLGELFVLFEFGVALGGALLEVNPFDQPGVEAYKRNMFRLLGKPAG
jgi:glucose-6-phosphate isomerase